MSNLTKSEDIIWRQIGDETVVIKDNGLSTHVLNKTAGYIWELCDGTRGTDGIAVKICERFDVTPQRASADVKETIGQLIDIGIINQEG